jgi:hypothetical protein
VFTPTLLLDGRKWGTLMASKFEPGDIVGLPGRSDSYYLVTKYMGIVYWLRLSHSDAGGDGILCVPSDQSCWTKVGEFHGL